MNVACMSFPGLRVMGPKEQKPSLDTGHDLKGPISVPVPKSAVRLNVEKYSAWSSTWRIVDPFFLNTSQYRSKQKTDVERTWKNSPESPAFKRVARSKFFSLHP